MKRFSFTLAAALLATTAALANPSLKGEITVNADIVTVGDMFDNAGGLSETAIFRAPAPGTTGIVPLADVQRAARLIGLSDFDNVGFTRVRVVRASTLVDAPALDKLIEADLASRGVLAGDLSADIHFDRSDIAFNAAEVDRPARLTELRYTQDGGAFTARFMIAGIDQPIDLAGTIELMTTAPRLITTRPAGAILAAADFEMAAVPLSTAAAGSYADLSQLVGKQLARQSRAGIMLKPADVAEPTVVARNSLVTVLLRAGAMTLTVKGQALNTASAGQAVDVLNTVTKKILHGIATPDGTVEIVTSSTTKIAAL